MKAFNIKDLYLHAQQESADLLPASVGMDFWDEVYTGTDKPVIDREFARRFSGFTYYDFLMPDDVSTSLADLKSDITSILTFNKKRYEEMYRVFLVSDEDDPITYNYDMTETTGAQHTETTYGQSTFTKGSETFTKGQQENTNGQITDSHNVAPYNSLTATMPESEDITSSQTITEGQRSDTEGQRVDTTGEHTDETDSDEWTLTRKGNIGVQTAADILRIHTEYWTEKYKFLQLIFDDICKQLLFAEV